MKKTLLCMAVSAALTIPAAAFAAAQATAAGSAQEGVRTDTLETITVTARRREEPIEKVPVAISAFSADDLADLQATSIDGLQGAVPGLNVVQGRGSSSAANVFIRGIGQPDALQTFDPGVGMYVDDVYYSRIQGALMSLFDVNHIEVLRGPQGTLYGKNSTGGAIKIVTRQPGEVAEGAVELTVGNHGRRAGQFYLAAPLAEQWSGSIAGTVAQDDGYIRDPDSGRKFNDDDTKAVRGKLRYDNGSFDATLSMDYTRLNTGLTMGQPIAPLIQTDLALGPVVLLPAPEGEYDFRSRTSFGPDKGQKMTHQGAALHMNWDLSTDWQLKSISAWRKLDSESYIDIDASEYELGDVQVNFNQKQLSQELQLQYDNGDNMQAVYGLYYLNEKVPSHQEAYADDLFALAGAPIDFLRTIDDELDTTSMAAFAHVNWEFVPTWTLAAGLRYTSEKKEYDRSTSTFWGAPFAGLNETVAFDGSKRWNAWTPSVSLSKQITPQTMAYVSANRGFKSGGFNGRANAVVETQNAAFDPEYVWTYEIGAKMRSDDGRMSANIAAFQSQYRDFQARVSEVLDPDSDTPTFSFPVLNAAKLSMTGVEFEGMAMFGSGTRLSTQLAYLDAKYDRFDDPRTLIDPALANLHDHVPFSPKWTARVALSQSFFLASGAAITVGADAAYRDDTWLSVDNRAGLMQRAYTVTGLFGLFDSADGAWQLRAGVRNLGDKVYRTDGQEFSSVGNIQTVYYGWPRNWYVGARYSF